jgi:aminomethyltransferase
LALRKAKGSTQVRVGLESAGRRVPREHYAVFQDEDRVGEVTSGSFSPTLDKPIAMAYVRQRSSEPGTGLLVDVRGRRQPACVVPLPFIKRPAR